MNHYNYNLSPFAASWPPGIWRAGVRPSSWAALGWVASPWASSRWRPVAWNASSPRTRPTPTAGRWRKPWAARRNGRKGWPFVLEFMVSWLVSDWLGGTIYLPTYLSIYLPIYLSIYLSIYYMGRFGKYHNLWTGKSIANPIKQSIIPSS